MEDTCVLCHATGTDKRTLRIGCLYQMDEILPEFKQEEWLWKMLICKACRASLLTKIQDWGNERRARRHIVKDHDGNELPQGERNVPVRENGAIVWKTMEEWLTGG